MGGSEKLTLSFSEQQLTHLRTQMTLTGKVPSLGKKGGYTRTDDAYTVHLCVVNIKMNSIL